MTSERTIEDLKSPAVFQIRGAFFTKRMNGW
jgi:hypothetical protein